MKGNTAQIAPLSKNHWTELKKLKQKNYRKEQQKTLVEGLNIIEQLIDNGLQPLELLTTEKQAERELLKRLNCPVYTTNEHQLSALTETESPQGMVALYDIPEHSIKQFKTALYLDGIRDPGNLGTIFRLVAAFAWDGIFLSPDCCEVFSPKVIRASLGSVFWIPASVNDIQWLSEQKAEIAGLTMTDAIDIRKFKRQKDMPFILVIGSEAAGINPSIQKIVSSKISISMKGRMESLNAAVATGIALFKLSGSDCD